MKRILMAALLMTPVITVCAAKIAAEKEEPKHKQILRKAQEKLTGIKTVPALAKKEPLPKGAIPIEQLKEEYVKIKNELDKTYKSHVDEIAEFNKFRENHPVKRMAPELETEYVALQMALQQAKNKAEQEDAQKKLEAFLDKHPEQRTPEDVKKGFEALEKKLKSAHEKYNAAEKKKKVFEEKLTTQYKLSVRNPEWKEIFYSAK